jgi:Transposase IS66 family.
VENEIKKQLIDSPVIHLDETSMRIKGKREWLHVVSTEFLTYYAAHHSRGAEANKAMGILPVFKGIAVHDGWKAYFKFSCLHALCNAHHLRELLDIAEGDGQKWPNDMIDLLLEIKKTAKERRSIDSWLDPAEVERFEVRYNQIIQKGLLENPPPKTPGRVHYLLNRDSEGHHLFNSPDMICKSFCYGWSSLQPLSFAQGNPQL